MYRHLMTIAALIGSLATVTGQAAPMAGNSDNAYYIAVPVIDVSPVTSRRTVSHPVQECRTVEPAYSYREHRRPYRQRDAVVPGILGGLIGGLVGNQFGGGSGRTALTVIGAFAGSSIARQSVAQHNGYHYDDYRQPRSRRICETGYRERTVDEVIAYDVTYEYAGQRFVKRVSDHPGDEIRVQVEVTPDFSS
ncbi:MAG: glycine zipper 2TM domain-containing protein [Pseudomonadales bacterium]|nr:glycine zipper 2TM domain-containing protein [Pseudomonadales bacterium]